MMMRKAFLALVIWLCAVPAQGGITRGPFLQPTEDLASSISIAWLTDTPSAGTVLWGVETTGENSLAEAAEAADHCVTLTRLAPGTAYKYQVRSGETTTPVHTFTTSSAAGECRVLVLADVHAQSPADAAGWVKKQQYMLPDMLSFGPHLVIMAGDIVQDGSVCEQYDVLFRTYGELFASAIVAPSPGNHEWAKGDKDLAIYTAQWHLPVNCPGFEEMSYFFDYAGVRFVSFDNRRFKELAGWLQAALAAPQANFIVPYHHYPPYLSCEWDDEMAGDIAVEAWKAPLRALLETAGADLDIGGHRHFYQRTLPILSSLPSPQCAPPAGAGWGGPETAETASYADPAGVIYMQMFSTMAQREGVLYKRPYFASCGPEAQVDGPSWMGFGTMTVCGKTLAFDSYAYSLDGSVRKKHVDHFVIDKRAAGTPQPGG